MLFHDYFLGNAKIGQKPWKISDSEYERATGGYRKTQRLPHSKCNVSIIERHACEAFIYIIYLYYMCTLDLATLNYYCEYMVHIRITLPGR